MRKCLHDFKFFLSNAFCSKRMLTTWYAEHQSSRFSYTVSSLVCRLLRWLGRYHAFGKHVVTTANLLYDRLL
jgi:hypothetical protein